MADLTGQAAPRAFHGDPTIKADLLAAMGRGDPTPLVWGQAAQSAAQSAAQPEAGEWAGRVGLPEALVLLTAHLGGRFTAATSGGAFARDLVSAIEPGVSIEGAAHELAIWAWEAAPKPLLEMMTSEQFLGAGGEVAALHRRAAEGEDVTRGEWRTARATLGRLGRAEDNEDSDDQCLAAAVMAACAWDYRTTPGAAVDMYSAWEGLAAEGVRRADGWGKTEDERLQQLIQEKRALALQQIGPEPVGGDPDAAADHSRRLVSAMLELLNTSDDPMPGRKAALNEQIGEARTALRKQGCAALLGLVRTLATAGVD